MAMKFLQKLFHRKNAPIVLSAAEAFTQPEEKNEELPGTVPDSEPEMAQAAPEECAAEEKSESREPVRHLWLYACLNEPSGCKLFVRSQLISQLRAMAENENGFSGALVSGAEFKADVQTHPTYVTEQAGYLKSRFAETYLTDRDVQNAAMMQIELFNTRVEFTLFPPFTDEDEKAFLETAFCAAQPMRGFILNEQTELYRWDRRLVISQDGRTDFTIFMPIKRGTSQSDSAESAASDEARKKRTLEALKAHGIAFPSESPVQAREAEAKLRTPEEIVNRLAAVFACAVKAQAYTSPRDVNVPATWSMNAIKRLDAQYGVNRLFTGKESDYIVRAQEERHAEYLLRFESCAVLLWALKLYHLDWPSERVNADDIVRIIRDADTEMLLRIAKPRPLGEILNMHDLVYRLHSLCVREGDTVLKEAGVDYDVVYERHYALNWLLAVDGISDWDMVVPKT